MTIAPPPASARRITTAPHLATGEGGSIILTSSAAGLEANPRVAGMLANSLPIVVTGPEDQANAVLFLASDESRYVTALAMTVDAGNTQY